MNKLFPFTILLLIFLLSCSEENPVNQIDLRGTISGTVVDTSGNHLSGVDVSTSGSHDAVTGTDGTYKIPDVEGGTYTLTFTKTGYQPKTEVGVTVAKLEEVIDVSVSLVPAPIKIVSGTITGAIDSVDHITVTISNNSDTTKLIYNASWFVTSGEYNIATEIPENGTLFTAEIKVYADSSRVIGYAKEEYNAIADAVPIPTFNAENAKPQITILSDFSDTMFFAEDTVNVEFTTNDIFGEITKCYSMSKNGNYSESDSNKTIITINKLSKGIQAPIGKIKAVDNSGNETEVNIIANVGLFSEIYSFDSSVSPYDAIELESGNFLVLAGYSSSGSFDPQNSFLIELNSNGEIIDTFNLGYSSLSMVRNNDEIYVAGSNLNEIVLTKFNNNGEVVKEVKYPIASNDSLVSSSVRDIICNKSGEILIGGHLTVFKDSSYSSSGLIAKFYDIGNMSWQKAIDTISGINSLIEISTNDIIVNSTTDLVLKLDTLGSVLWCNSYGNRNEGFGITETDNGTIIFSDVSGTSSNIRNIDTNGTILWESYSNSQRAFWRGPSILKTNVRNYLVTTYTQKSGEDLNYRLIDDKANVLWENTVDINSRELLAGALETTSGGYFMWGFSGNNEKQNLLFMNIDSDGSNLPFKN